MTETWQQCHSNLEWSHTKSGTVPRVDAARSDHPLPNAVLLSRIGVCTTAES